MTDLPKSAQKVVEAMQSAGLTTDVLKMPTSTRTAEDAANACRCATSQIVKSLVFQGKTSEQPILLLVSGTNRVDQDAVADRIGESLKRPDAAYVRDITGFAIGGIPPLGHATPMKTFFDQDLLDHERVWAAAGTPDCVFSSNPQELAQACGATIIKVC